MEFLIPDLLLIIFEYCPLSDLVRFKRINKRFNKLISDNYQSKTFNIIINQAGKEMRYDHTPEVTLKIYPERFIDSKINQFISDFNNRVNDIKLDYHSSRGFRIYLTGAYNQFCRLVINDKILTIRMVDYLPVHISFRKNEIELLRLFSLIKTDNQKIQNLGN